MEPYVLTVPARGNPKRIEFLVLTQNV